jgi:hypothetical protein
MPYKIYHEPLKAPLTARSTRPISAHGSSVVLPKTMTNIPNIGKVICR